MLLLDENRVLFKNEQNRTKTSQTNKLQLWSHLGKLPLTFHPSNCPSENCRWGTGKVNPRHLQRAHPEFLGSDVYMAQGQLKREDLVQWEQILRQPVRLKPRCDGSVLLVKLVFQEGKENEGLHPRISFGKYMKIFMLPALHSQMGHWNFLHKAGLNKKIL